MRAAIDLFTLKGYRVVSIEAVAEAAGMSRSTVFWHFRNKRQLLSEVVDHVATEQLQGVIESVGDAHGIEAVRTFATSRTRMLETQPELIRALYVLMGEGIGYEPTAAAKLHVLMHNICSQLVQWLRDAQAAGELRRGVEPEKAAVVIFGALHGTTLQSLLAPDEYDIAAADAAIDSTIALMCDDPDQSARPATGALVRSKRQ